VVEGLSVPGYSFRVQRTNLSWVPGVSSARISAPSTRSLTRAHSSPAFAKDWRRGDRRARCAKTKTYQRALRSGLPAPASGLDRQSALVPNLPHRPPMQRKRVPRRVQTSRRRAPAPPALRTLYVRTAVPSA
jgi:hypothetical protein